MLFGNLGEAETTDKNPLIKVDMVNVLANSYVYTFSRYETIQAVIWSRVTGLIQAKCFTMFTC